MNPIDFLSEFQAEAGEKLDVIANQLLRLERDATNAQPVREMFLAAHTVKGGAAMLRLTDVEALAHGLEDLLTAFRDQGRSLDPTTADLLFQAIDMLRALVLSAGEAAIGAEPGAAVVAFTARLREAATGTPAPAPAPVAAAPTDARTVRALVVDDSATVRELHSILLEDAGYEVRSCADGEEALSLALGETYAVVVAGLQLRGLHGFELSRKLRASTGYATVPIVLLSSDADAVLEAQAKQSGATALLRKSGAADSLLVKQLAA